ncbi:methyltransferase domain-containing protein [Novosphingobium sp. M1R2S20]|uniref:Methyltransferase domain-containing protein n=1 Tax=Novosphingobium rhizovicinum TaxID=3228928 RepID=A0ABV3RDJ5_9SPHN
MMATTVARAFAAAADYDRHARVQRLVARELAHRIATLPLGSNPRVLEVGCGTGFLTQALRAEGLAGDWLITDVAPAMIERARSRLGSGLSYTMLDGERGTPDGGPFDLVCASLATQWFEDEPAALARWREWLAPGGHVMVATLGPGTFAEWRSAHAAEGHVPGTPAFTPLAALEALRPADPLTVDIYRERHADARAFLLALRGIGADTSASGHRPLSPGALRRVMRRFEAAGAIATYEVVTCHLSRGSDQP